MLDHVSFGSTDIQRSKAFYDAALAPLGMQAIAPIEIEPYGLIAVGYGVPGKRPKFWTQLPGDQQPATQGNGSHLAFVATSEAQVQAFFEAATAAGGTSDGPPGPRPHYGDAYYGAFVRDPDGHKIEAVFIRA